MNCLRRRRRASRRSFADSRPATSTVFDPRGVEGLEDDPLSWVREYPADLVPLPGDVWAHPGTDSFRFSDESGWAVVLPLWTTAESPSDLSLEMSVTKRGSDFMFETDNMHVM
jgi:hypothetical protein